MKVGVILPMFSGDMSKVLDAARATERLGYDGVFAFDHFFPPGGSPDQPSLEAFTTLAAVAAVTERVSLGTLVTRAVLRPAGLVAKMASTIDHISRGRLVIGVGTGDPIDRPEHEAYGFPNLSVAGRRAHLAETVRAWKALFHGDPFPGGEWIPPMDGPLIPPPTRPEGPPVWLGAQSEAVIKLAGELADGWNGWGLAPLDFERKARVLAEAAGAAGRTTEATWAGIVLVGEDDEDVRRLRKDRREKGLDGLAWSGSAEEFRAFLGDLNSAGASWAIIVLAGPPGRRELIAERVLGNREKSTSR